MRTRRAVAIAAAVSTVLLAYYAIAWAQVTPQRERGTDFSASYVAALLVRSGDGAQLYNQQAEHARHLAVLPPGTVINLPFITPPTTALLALPLTALDPGTAFRVWSLVELILLGLAVWVAIRAGPWPAGAGRASRAATFLMALAAGGTYAFLLLGQIDGIAALGLAVAYASWRRQRIGRRRLLAGARLCRNQATPRDRARHLAGGAARLARARRRDLRLRRDRGDLAGAGRPLRPRPASCSALGFAIGNTPAASTLGIQGLVTSWLGSGDLAVGISILGSLIVLAGCAVLGSRSRGKTAALELSLAGAVALSLVASPHLLPHDLVILAPAFAWCMARAAGIDAGPWPGLVTIRVIGAWAVLGVLTLVDTGNAAPAPPGRLVPLALLGIGIAALMIPATRAVAGQPARVAVAQSGGGRGAGGSTA